MDPFYLGYKNNFKFEQEKRAMNKLWKKREKEIMNVISATTDMYGSIQGISGNAIKPVSALELPLLETEG